jgi:hypothetical protein
MALLQYVQDVANAQCLSEFLLSPPVATVRNVRNARNVRSVALNVTH